MQNFRQTIISLYLKLKYAIHPPPRLSVGGGILANFW